MNEPALVGRELGGVGVIGGEPSRVVKPPIRLVLAT